MKVGFAHPKKGSIMLELLLFWIFARASGVGVLSRFSRCIAQEGSFFIAVENLVSLEGGEGAVLKDIIILCRKIMHTCEGEEGGGSVDFPSQAFSLPSEVMAAVASGGLEINDIGFPSEDSITETVQQRCDILPAGITTTLARRVGGRK